MSTLMGESQAQVTRLSLLYALLDGSDMVRVPHMLSALELWAYSERSAQYIFGDATGNPTADTIYRALQNGGRLTRAQISRLFSGHAQSSDIDMALAYLLEKGLARPVMEETGGRPTEAWELVEQ